MANSEESQKSSKIKNNIFENEEMSRHLRRLLHSKDPSDLQTANRLIKFMVKEVPTFLKIFEIKSLERLRCKYFILHISCFNTFQILFFFLEIYIPCFFHYTYLFL